MNKKTFNLSKYRTAMGVNRYNEPDTGSVIEGPDMENLDESQWQGFLAWLQKNHPGVAKTVDEAKAWFNANILGKLSPMPDQVAKDQEHHF